MRAAAVDDLVEGHGPLPVAGAGRAPAGAHIIGPDRAGKGGDIARIDGFAYLPAMPVMPILIHPDPRLKKVSPPVEEITGDLRRLADDMLATMYDAPGIGLAAPQVGVNRRLIVLDCEKDREKPPRPIAMFNPEVIASSDEKATYEEGCLSIPEQFAEIERPAEVTVRWIAPEGEERQEDFAGLWATCVQHEIDHLDGVLFIDYLKPLKRQMITRKMQKLKRERARA
jgi:peptide deformylase